MKSLGGEKPLSRLELVENLKDQSTWIQIKERYIKERAATREAEEERKRLFEKMGGWSPTPSATKTEEIILYSKTHPELNWKTHSKVDQTLGNGEYLEGIRTLLISDMGYTVTGNYPFSEEDIHKIASYPWSTFITDQRAVDNSKYSFQNAADRLTMEHPRGWGTYAKILGEYVREKKILNIEDAIRKITSLPANILGLNDRGLIKEGFWADIVVFNPDTVKSNATYENPFEFPSGIPYVFVNGKLAKDGKITGTLSGKILRRE
jgi:N-acyl-D-aspartate/D-glutamate deacylase